MQNALPAFCELKSGGRSSSSSSSNHGKMQAVIGMLRFLLVAACMSLNIISASPGPCYPALFMFGDSLSDTGNGPFTGSFLAMTEKPNGETFPGRPFDRFCDGRLLIDYLATHLGLPFLNPSLNTTANFTAGVNYAVSGATALSASYLNTQGIYPHSQDSLDIQLSWHLALKADVESSNGTLIGRPSLSSFTNGLYAMGIGGDDYMNAFLQPSYPPAYVNSTFVPLVIQKIRNATETLYNNGARNFMLFSISPLGCNSAILSSFIGVKDSNGCLQDYNSVAYTHGVKLLVEVESLMETYQDATFLFMDFFGAYTFILRNRGTFGFVDAFDSCCGAGANFPYNFSLLDFCNNQTTSLCSLIQAPTFYGMASTSRMLSTPKFPINPLSLVCT